MITCYHKKNGRHTIAPPTYSCLNPPPGCIERRHEALGLVDSVFVVKAGSRGFDSLRRHVSERFSDPIDQDIRTKCTLSWEIVVSEWRLVIAESLNAGSGVRLTKPAKL